jgi:hypothetical protein
MGDDGASTSSYAFELSCRCADRGRCILAGRLGLGLAIEAFRAAQRTRCMEHEQR